MNQKVKKGLKIVGIILLTFVALSFLKTTFAFVSCIVTYDDGYLKNGTLGRNEYMSGDYVYSKKRYKNESMAILIALSPEGKTKKVLMIPQTIDGYKVMGFGANNITDFSCFISENLEVIYIPTNIIGHHNRIASDAYIFTGCGSLKEIYSVYPISDYILWDNNKELEHIYLFNIASNERYIEANVLYHNNYEMDQVDSSEYLSNNMSYDYFIVDNGEYGYTITPLLRDPERIGYIFDGWYKEPECINEWDYDTDTLPAPIYDDDVIEIYQETILYAKWIENE